MGTSSSPAQQQHGAKVLKRSQDVEEEEAIKARAMKLATEKAAAAEQQGGGIINSVSQFSSRLFGGGGDEGSSTEPVKEEWRRSGISAPLGTAPRRRLPSKEEEDAARTRKQRQAADEVARREAEAHEAHLSEEEKITRKKVLAFIKAASQGRTDECLEMVESGCSANATDDHGRTAIHAASAGGHLETIEALLDLDDIDDEILDKQGKAPMHTACQHGRTEVLEFFVDLGMDVNMPAGKKAKCRTPLMFAAANGHVDIIGALLHADVDLIDAKDSEGCTALQIAFKAEQMEAADALEGAAEARRLASKRQQEESMVRKKRTLQRTNTRMLLKTESRFSLRSMLQAAQKQHQDQNQQGWDRLLRHAKEVNEEKKSRASVLRMKLHKGFRTVSMAAGALAHLGRRSSQADTTLVLSGPPQVRKSKSDQGKAKATFDVTVRT